MFPNAINLKSPVPATGETPQPAEQEETAPPEPMDGPGGGVDTARETADDSCFQFARPLTGLQAYAASGPAQQALADSLELACRESRTTVVLPAGAVRVLPPPEAIRAMAASVTLLQLAALRDDEVTDVFVASLAAFGADALLLSGQASLPAALAGVVGELYVCRSPRLDVSTEAVKKMLREHPGLRLVVDMSVKGTSRSMHQFPGQIEMRVQIGPDLLDQEISTVQRWAPNLSEADRTALRQAPAGEKNVIRQSLCKCESFAGRRPEFVSNIRLLLRIMAADPDFRRDACAQIEAWSPLCADDWIACISTVISSRRAAGPIATVRDGALRIFWQSLLQEADRIVLMRDPAMLPPGAWDIPERSLATETALMLRQTIDTLMAERFAMRTTRPVPQLYSNQSALDEAGARRAIEAIVLREKQAGFALATLFSKDSGDWKAFVATLPGVRAELQAALKLHTAALAERPADEMEILRAYEKDVDAIRARPLLEALRALI